MATENKVDYGNVLADLQAKKAEIENAIKGIEAVMGLALSGGAEITHIPTHGKDGGGHSAVIADDTFFNMTIVEAAKKYLAMGHRQPKSTQEVLDALQKGGLQSAIYDTVSALISRKAKRGEDFVKLPKRKWGLVEWYGTPKGIKKKKPSGGNEESSEASVRMA